MHIIFISELRGCHYLSAWGGYEVILRHFQEKHVPRIGWKENHDSPIWWEENHDLHLSNQCIYALSPRGETFQMEVICMCRWNCTVDVQCKANLQAEFYVRNGLEALYWRLMWSISVIWAPFSAVNQCTTLTHNHANGRHFQGYVKHYFVWNLEKITFYMLTSIISNKRSLFTNIYECIRHIWSVILKVNFNRWLLSATRSTFC